MKIRTIESDFEHQSESIFESMLEDYREEQKNRKDDEDEVETFADWLWVNRADLGEAFYNRFNEYAGIDESTKKYNSK